MDEFGSYRREKKEGKKLSKHKKLKDIKEDKVRARKEVNEREFKEIERGTRIPIHLLNEEKGEAKKRTAFEP
ncbi:hypothetical protein QR98_0102260 [Sarcoptes scabiei]|uniref:Uncharacterized protein n=1 Tax=Sarcoptes scabiei TaxID=52283 RepID=A0A132AL56_SARSC|nr:hypothetical protein QR98_0102260 [Sarcoptes scabiei]